MGSPEVASRLSLREMAKEANFCNRKSRVGSRAHGVFYFSGKRSRRATSSGLSAIERSVSQDCGLCGCHSVMVSHCLKRAGKPMYVCRTWCVCSFWKKRFPPPFISRACLDLCPPRASARLGGVVAVLLNPCDPEKVRIDWNFREIVVVDG